MHHSKDVTGKDHPQKEIFRAWKNSGYTQTFNYNKMVLVGKPFVRLKFAGSSIG